MTAQWMFNMLQRIQALGRYYNRTYPSIVVIRTLASLTSWYTVNKQVTMGRATMSTKNWKVIEDQT